MKEVSVSFNLLDLTLCEIESFQFEPRNQVSFRLLQRVNREEVHLVELTISRVARAVIHFLACPWVQGVIRHSCSDESEFLDKIPEASASAMGQLFHFHIQAGDHSFDIAAESYTFSLLDVITRA